MRRNKHFSVNHKLMKKDDLSNRLSAAFSAAAAAKTKHKVKSAMEAKAQHDLQKKNHPVAKKELLRWRRQWTTSFWWPPLWPLLPSLLLLLLSLLQLQLYAIKRGSNLPPHARLPPPPSWCNTPTRSSEKRPLLQVGFFVPEVDHDGGAKATLAKSFAAAVAWEWWCW